MPREHQSQLSEKIEGYNPDLIEKSAPDKLFHYIVLYMENINPKNAFTGIETTDAKNGIHHLKIHQGILQSIDFQKSDQPFLRETKYFKHNENPLQHLSNVYNVRLTTVGNTLFYPGDTLYINPIGFGVSLGSPMNETSLSNVMGLGGYHTVISVQNKVSKDFTTDIVAQWTSNGSNKPGSDWPTRECPDIKPTGAEEDD